MAEKPASPHLFADVLARVHAICAALATEGNWPAGIDFSRVVVEPPRDASHGDMATNAAMVLAKEAKAKPRDLAGRSDRLRRRRRARFHQSHFEASGLGRRAAHGRV
jgi:arginyl-tRNA synthetase